MNRDNFTEKLVKIGLYMLKYASIFMFKIAAAAILEKCKLKKCHRLNSMLSRRNVI